MTRLYAQNRKVVWNANPLYNPVGMYFGLASVVHFPCKLDCKQTKRVVDERMKILKRYEEIYTSLSEIQKYKISVSANGRYTLIKE